MRQLSALTSVDTAKAKRGELVLSLEEDATVFFPWGESVKIHFVS
jgi:hypothetical protein